MNAVTQTEARAINTAAAIPLEAADPTKNLILVPLSRLVSRPTGRNVRKTPRMSIPELAASIQRVGLLQNLIVIAAADGEHYEVVAGGRRLAALKLLAKKHRISKEWEVPCLLVADGTARTASLTENVQREAMHPPTSSRRSPRWWPKAAHRGHCSGFQRHAAGGAAPLEAGERLAAPAGRLPRRGREP
jgi:ParB family chromosome partitioning protein